MRVSMADVAERAGVSAQTVSRVANGSPRVDPATRVRVEKAMADLGYRMHRAARALRTGQTSTIGLVVSTLASVGNSRMLQAISEAAAARDYALAVVTVGEAASTTPFARLRSQGVDGAVVLNEATELARDTQPPADLHLVVVDSPPDERFSIVQTDHAGGARAATRYLLELGHSTVHHLAGPARSFAAAERERGWREALADAGVAAPEPVRGDWTSASGHLSVSELLEATAIFVANDQMALGAPTAPSRRRGPARSRRRLRRRLRRRRGCRGVPPAPDHGAPGFDALGRRAVAALVGAIEGGEPVVETVPASVIVRRSTAEI